MHIAGNFTVSLSPEKAPFVKFNSTFEFVLFLSKIPTYFPSRVESVLSFLLHANAVIKNAIINIFFVFLILFLIDAIYSEWLRPNVL